MWIVFFCLWWMGMSRLVQRTWARRVLAGQVAVMIVFLAGTASWIHWNRGIRTLHHGPTLENQMAVARELDRLGAAEVPECDALHPCAFPHAIGTLRRLHRREEGVVLSAAPRTSARVVYAEPDGGSGEIAVEPLPPP
jgi:hypothetical protein